jgi:hypothetical protein
MRPKITLPFRSTATQESLDGEHETPLICTAPSMSSGTQLDAGPVGSVETKAWPALSTATHSVVDGHDTPSKRFESTDIGADQAAAPPTGSVETVTSPALSTATQRVEEGHETPLSEAGSICAGVHA